MKKHINYLKYLVRHKWFVLVAGLRTGAPLWRLIIHDWSKFLPSEWFPYVDYFYGEKLSDEKVMENWRREQAVLGYRMSPSNEMRKAAFDKAWLHHQHRNPHHWQHWVLREDSGETVALWMPEHFIREMVADWAGAGRAITGKWEVAEWYSKNRHKMALSATTEKQVEWIIRRV